MKKTNTNSRKPEAHQQQDLAAAYRELEADIHEAAATATIVMALFETFFEKVDPAQYEFAKGWEASGYQVYIVPNAEVTAFTHAIYECNGRAQQVARKHAAPGEVAA